PADLTGPISLDGPSCRADLRTRAKCPFGRGPAQGHDQDRIQHLHLPSEPRPALGYLGSLWLAVSRWAALDDVRDGHSVARQSSFGQERPQPLPRAPHDRYPPTAPLPPRPLADEQDIGPRRGNARDHPRPPRDQLWASDAAADGVGQRRPRTKQRRRP